MEVLKIVYPVYLLLISVVAFIAYGADKKKAKKGSYRTPEKTLIILSLLGGAFGGYAAMFYFRHKTRHWYFHLFNILGIILSVAILCYLFFFM